MTNYHRFTLKNGLRVIFHRDETTPIAVVNTLYNVGARDESPSMTGLAHFFEHLMFSGSKNVENFDRALQKVGGQSNAFTSNDITNYYIQLPKNQIETALWVESDRMTQLILSDKNLETQRKVVIEEFKQRYLNQPYGDTWMELRPLAFKEHPYQWATIGKNVEHIEKVTMDDAMTFYRKHYHPRNAILSIAGNFEIDEVQNLVESWFGELQTSDLQAKNIPSEPIQLEYRKKIITRNVPACAFYFAFKMQDRMSKQYPIADLITDILGRGKSSLLYQRYFDDLHWVSEISSYILGSIDDGLLIISGKMHDASMIDGLEQDLWNFLEHFKMQHIQNKELEKVRNKFLTGKLFEELSLQSRAMNLAYFELLGNIDLINTETELYLQVDEEDIKRVAQEILQQERCTCLIIQPISHDKK